MGNYLVENMWTHVDITYDGSKSASGAHIYIDGSPVATAVIIDALS